MEWVVSTALSVLIPLVVTFVFNYFTGLPKRIRDIKKADKEKEDKIQARLAALETSVAALPVYRAQSLEIQKKLKDADVNILEVCNAIKEDVMENRREVVAKLERLEEREKNALRAKILEEHRLYTDSSRNPMHAWSEMEAHSFNKLVEDYEALGGNDYVHNIVLPEINHLNIVYMNDLEGLKKLYDSRKVK